MENGSRNAGTIVRIVGAPKAKIIVVRFSEKG